MSKKIHSYINKHGIQCYIHLSFSSYLLDVAKKISDKISVDKPQSFIDASWEFQSAVEYRRGVKPSNFFISRSK